MKSLEQQGFEFANFHHFAVGQLRKYSGRPYIDHPRAVVQILRGVPGVTMEMLAAGWAHDTVEDTNATHSDVHRTLGLEVGHMVVDLTDCDKSTGNREERKALDRERLRVARNEVKTVKLADCLHNTEDILENDPKFAIQYFKEMRLLVPCLVGGDPELWFQLNTRVEAFYATT